MDKDKKTAPASKPPLNQMKLETPPVEKDKRVARGYLIPVSKTNFNRVKFGSHSLVNVLVKEGYRVANEVVEVDGKTMRLRDVGICIREKPASWEATTPKSPGLVDAQPTPDCPPAQTKAQTAAPGGKS